MSVHHHPGEDLLLAYASGSSDEALSLVIASHLVFCPRCRRDLAALEAAGGVLLSDLAPASLAVDALNRTLARLGEQETARRPAPVISSVPAPLRPYVGKDFSQVAWRRIAPGIAYHPFYSRGRTRAQLIRVAAGHGVAEHGHQGSELSLVLEGGYTDETGQYAVGDFQTTSPEIVHTPTADADGTCIILAVTEAPLLFRGLLPRLIGKLAGF